MKLKQVLIFVLVLAYVLSPIDLIPEAFVPVVGWLDDLGILAWAVASYMRSRKAAQATTDRAQPRVSPEGRVIDA